MRPPAWAVASSAGGVVALVGGWLVAGAVQPPGYDPVRQTISALARHGLDHRWIMTAGLAGLGVAHIVTAAGLPPLTWWSRSVLALGGAATLAVAMFAQPSTGSSAAHIAFAALGFVVLALWPATTMSREPGTPGPLRAPVAISVTVCSLGLLGWVAAGGALLGVSERLLSAQQAVWPLVVVLALRRTARMAG